ncbi:MAG: hypothetical protein KatS3mg050_4664 [Litorilinea sp.]|nr:MAG: hypothetical protein KatS3mg050_4664 [Litorilinea sp.]
MQTYKIVQTTQLRGLLSLLVASGLLLAACQSAVPASPATSVPTNTPVPSTSTPESIPTAEGQEAQKAEARTVRVSLTEFTIEMPNTVPAGPTLFEVTNEGSFAHNFKIEGQGIEEVFQTTLAPGETRTMQIELPPGEYRVYCPVDGHARRGMDLQLSVSGAAETSQAEATPAPSSEGADEENGSYGGYRY